MVIVGLIAFLVLGPEEMIRKARDVGVWMGRFQNEVQRFKSRVQEEIDVRDRLPEVPSKRIDELEQDIEKKIQELSRKGPGHG